MVMTKYKIVFIGLLMQLSSIGFTSNCPDPATSSLQWGVPPEPWVENPASANSPQGEDNTKFVRANILVTSRYGQGVTCTYKNSVGEYSILWLVLTKRPSRADYTWIDTPGGYVCTRGLTECQFYTAN